MKLVRVMRHRLLRLPPAATSTLLRFASIALGTAASIAIARVGGQSVKGLVAMLGASASAIAAFAGLGYAEQVVQEFHENQWSPRRMLATLWITYGLVVGVVAVTAPERTILIAVATMLFLAPSQAGVVALGIRGVVTQNIGALLQPAVSLALLLPFAIDGNLSATEAVLVLFSGYVAPLPYYWNRIHVQQLPNISVQRPRVSQILRSGVRGSPWLVPNSALRLLGRLDILIVGKAFGLASAGVYSVAATMVGFATIVTRQQAGHAYHQSVSGGAASRRAGLQAGVSAAVALLFITPASVVLIPLLFGADFQGAIVLVALLAPGTVALSVTSVYIGVWRSRRQLRRMMGAVAVGITSMLVIASALGPVAGPPGIAGASSVANVLLLFTAQLLERRGRRSRTRVGSLA